VVAVLAAWWLVRDLDWEAMVGALRQADYRWVAVGVLAIVATAWTRTWRWEALLVPTRVRFYPALKALVVGQAVSIFVPLRGGDVVRAVWLGAESKASASQALGSVVLEKVWDLLALLLCGIALLVLMPLPGWFSRSTWGTALSLGVGVPLLWAGLRWKEFLLRYVGAVLARLPGGVGRVVMGPLERVAEGMDSLRRADASAWAFAWTVATWGLGGFANWAILTAFGLPSVAASLLLLVTLMVGNSVITTPARLGVFEGLVVVSLELFGVERNAALAMGLVLHVVVMGPPLVLSALLALAPPLLKQEDYGSA
jgi:hypothetical protein